ncbi:hypothetical protein H8959_015994 [Pygathrix nigripes]
MDGETFSQHLQAVKILAVRDLIWVPRRGGDVIVIGLEKDSGAQRGRVIAVLKARELTPHGVLVDAAVVAKDTVVCSFENENTEWCLAVWRGWGAREFDIFYQSYEELGRLEACTRKRRQEPCTSCVRRPCQGTPSLHRGPCSICWWPLSQPGCRRDDLECPGSSPRTCIKNKKQSLWLGPLGAGGLVT